jgi:hypothetical protein
MFENAKRKDGISEIFISSVIDYGLKSGTLDSLKKIHIENFTSLGTVDLIEAAILRNQLGGSFKESGSLFIDLDGTIFAHDSGGGVGKFSYQQMPSLVSEGIPEWLQTAKAAGYSIIITSARNEKSRDLLVDQLAALSIPYNQLILGLSGGPRFLFNDTKDSLACLPTAHVMNYPRNSFPVNAANKMLINTSKLSIHNEFKGESGERTFLVQGAEEFFVRKQSQDSDNSRNIIDYQVNWFQVVNEFYPKNIPRVIKTNIHSSDHLLYFDTEYIPDLMPLGKYLNQSTIENQKKKLEELSNILTGIYSIFCEKTSGNLNYVRGVIEAKARLGVINGFKSLHISLDMPITNHMNGKPLSDSWENISRVLDPEHSFIKELLNKSLDKRTLIHGDPTLSNIVCTKNGRILLLDPIGARVMPDFDQSKGLGRANPIFDHSRVRLSLEDEYERWADEIVVEEELGGANYFLPNQNKEDLFKHYQSLTSEFDAKSNLAIDDLIHITTLARIFPYKAKSKRKEAYYILGLLNEKCLQFSQEYL